MNPQVLRLLDANCNRAREALRVIEDYARFWIDDKQLSGDLKSLRHRLSTATSTFADKAMFFRDTPNDVGTANKTSQELYRSNPFAVVIAAGKRFGEAARAIEEFAKTFDAGIASEMESIRYSFYDLELRVARTFRPPELFRTVRLYVLITESLCKRPWREVVRDTIHGGADCLQLREKEMSGDSLLVRAREFVSLCNRLGAISIVNDRPDIALLSNADGVHVGQDDLPAIEVRKLLGPDKIIGVSTHTLEQARTALADGADYIGVGPAYKSATKPRDFLPGLPFAKEIARDLQDKIPAVAIAGINAENVDEVLATGIKAVAVSSAVIACEDVVSATRRLKDKLNHR